MSLIAEPTYEEFVNLFTNSNMVGDGTWAIVEQNISTDPTLRVQGGISLAGATGTTSRPTRGGPIDDGAWYQVLFLTPPTASPNTGQVSPTGVASAIPTTPGETITFSTYFMSSYVGWGGFRYDLTYYDSSGATISTPNGATIPVTNGWVRGIRTFVSPAGAVGVAARPSFSGGQGMPANTIVGLGGVHIVRSPIIGSYLDGSTKPKDLVQPEDFRTRWLGSVNASPSVLEIERVRGLNSSGCVAGVSTKANKPAVRLIPTSETIDCYASFAIPAGLSGVLLGTAHLDGPLTGTLKTDSSLRLTVTSPWGTYAPAPANTKGKYPQKFVFPQRTANGQARINHGGSRGSGDVWWTDFYLFSGELPGELTGDWEELYYKNVRVFPEWLGEPNNSPSRFRYYTRHEFDPLPTTTKWDAVGERRFETGVDRGMLYSSANRGVPWNGLTSISEKPNGGEPTPYFIDGVKYLNWPVNEDFQANLSAFTYPREFEPHDGMSDTGKGLSIAHQPRRPFGLSYRTRVGNDIDGVDHGYKIHLVYNAIASPSERANQTLSTDPEAIDFSWALTTTPVKLAGRKASAHLVIDSTRTDPYLLRELEEILYGTEAANPRLPTGQEIIDFFDNWATLIVIDYGDGTFTASGPDDVVYMADPTTFVIDWASAVYISNDTYTLSTL